jgi:hypothetical protein
MKKFLNSFLALALVANFACHKKDKNTPDPAPSTLELTGTLTTQTLDASKKYLIKGQVFVNNGVTLTIPAGTVIMGDKATKGTLVVNVGGTLNAIGTASNPIVFTSSREVGGRDKGDWGGIVLLGRANVNQVSPSIEGISPAVTYGTTNSATYNTESSGNLQYVRIEYAGIALSPNNETNSLTMGAIGSGTTIDYVQSSYGGDDSFEWFGGVVNCKHLIAFAGWDDDFDCDFGFSGNVQYAVSIRDPFSADQSASNGFEVDNDASGSVSLPKTSAVFSNVTIYGPKSDSTTSISGSYGSVAHLRRNSAVSIFNSVLAGFTKGFLLDGTSTETNYNNSTGVLSNNIIAATKVGAAQPTTVTEAGGITAGNAKTLWLATNKIDTIFTSATKVSDWAAVGLREANFYAENTTYPANPDFTQVTPTGTMMPSSSFSNAKVQGAFFTTTNFVGAFGTIDWTDMWSNFNPQTTAY